MKQTSVITRRLAEAQETHARHLIRESKNSVTFRLYTEHRSNLGRLVSRYFPGATILVGTGLWEGLTEVCAIIEIVATLDELQKIVDLAGDIREVNNQSGVLVTYQSAVSTMVDSDIRPVVSARLTV